MFQRTLFLLNYNGIIQNAQSIETLDGGIPCIGWTYVYGLVYSDVNVTLEISQGIEEVSGVKTYRFTDTIAIPGGTGVAVERKIYGARVRAKISNASGGNANVESILLLKAYS